MSEVKVNKISPRTNCGTVTLGDSGDSFVIPAGATITNNGTQTGFGRTGTVDWDTTPKTATFTAVSGDGFFADTTSGAFNMNLPAGTAGAIVSVADYAATFQNNALTVVPNGSQKIGGTNANVVLNTIGQSVTFVYVDDTQGWGNVQDSTTNARGNDNLIATGGTAEAAAKLVEMSKAKVAGFIFVINLYDLDGRKPGPLNCGSTTKETFLKVYYYFYFYISKILQ